MYHIIFLTFINTMKSDSIKSSCYDYECVAGVIFIIFN